MDRYSEIKQKFPREIVLLKGRSCAYGKCTFCDYIKDNSSDEELNYKINSEILQKVTGKYGSLEVINSGNIFELPNDTLNQIKEIIVEKNISTLFFESHYIYINRINDMRNFFGIETIVKTGLESFDYKFREEILQKGFRNISISELKDNFDSVCLMVGIKGQTKEMIDNDIKLAIEHFDHFTVNVYIENSTNIKPDDDLISWFEQKYMWLDKEPKCEVLWHNTDFGVGD